MSDVLCFVASIVGICHELGLLKRKRKNDVCLTQKLSKNRENEFQ